MKKIISFIIPAYNSQKYIKKCLDSFIVSGTEGRIEVIVVNDGSTDDTSSIATQYVERYPDIFCLRNKENGGHGSAINLGVKHATGMYIKVIDADDWIYSENLMLLLEALEKSDAQIFLLPYHTIDINTGERKEYSIFCSQFCRNYSLDEIVYNWRMFEHGLTFHGIIYSTDFYREYGISLVEHVFYEDHEYASIPFCKAERIYPLNICLYEYLIGNSQQSIAEENQVKRLSDCEIVINHMLSYYLKDRVLTKSGKSFFYKKVETVILSFYKTACLVQPDRKAGRKRCIEQNWKIFRAIPEWKPLLEKKYKIFEIASILGMKRCQYDNILNSNIYRRIRKK